jgi:hypothetical protein
VPEVLFCLYHADVAALSWKNASFHFIAPKENKRTWIQHVLHLNDTESIVVRSKMIRPMWETWWQCPSVFANCKLLVLKHKLFCEHHDHYDCSCQWNWHQHKQVIHERSSVPLLNTSCINICLVICDELHFDDRQ